jgi:hypothetical protein
MPERAFANSRDVGAAKPGFTPPLVQISLQLFAPFTFFFDLKQGGPLAAQGRGECVSQVPCDKLRQSRRIPMRNIAPLVPPMKANSLVVRSCARIPGALAFNQIADAGVIRRTRQAALGRRHGGKFTNPPSKDNSNLRRADIPARSNPRTLDSHEITGDMLPGTLLRTGMSARRSVSGCGRGRGWLR